MVHTYFLKQSSSLVSMFFHKLHFINLSCPDTSGHVDSILCVDARSFAVQVLVKQWSKHSAEIRYNTYNHETKIASTIEFEWEVMISDILDSFLYSQVTILLVTFPNSLRSLILCETSPTTDFEEDSSGVSITPVEPQTDKALCKPSKELRRIPHTSAWTCLKQEIV